MLLRSADLRKKVRMFHGLAFGAHSLGAPNRKQLS
jgi:hypothetical protein